MEIPTGPGGPPMTEHAEANLASPVGGLMCLAGLVAQAPAASVAVNYVGTIAAISGLLVALYPFYKTRHDAQQLRQEIGELRSALESSRRKRHDDRAHFSGMLLDLETKLEVKGMEVARLDGKLSAIDKSHTPAINANVDAIQKIADHMEPPLDVLTSHVGPVLPDSDTDDEYFPPTPAIPPKSGR